MKRTNCFSIMIIGTILVFNVFIINVFAKELPKVTVDKNKEFTITFNNELNKSSVNKNTVKVIDSKGQEVAVRVTTRSDNNKIAVVRPISEYTEGESYTLIVSPEVKAINNFKLSEEIKLKFTIKSAITQDPLKEDTNKSTEEIFINNLYKTNSPNWNQGAKFIDGKLNLYSYDYATEKGKWNVLATSYNNNINNQTLDIFKALYTEKKGCKTDINYFEGLQGNGGGLANISFSINNFITGQNGNSFLHVSIPDSKLSSYGGELITLGVSDCTKENFNTYKYTIKSSITPIINKELIDEAFDYIDKEYTKLVLDDYYNLRKNNSNKSIYEPTKSKDLYKTFGNIKLHIFSDGKGIGISFIKV